MIQVWRWARIVPAVLLWVPGASSARCTPPKTGPCASFHSNTTVQIDFEAPRYGATVGKNARVKLQLSVGEEEQPFMMAAQADLLICLSLDGLPGDCQPLSDAALTRRFTDLSPGVHCLQAWTQDHYQRRVGYNLADWTEFEVVDVQQLLQARDSSGTSLEIVAPTNLTSVPANTDALPVTIEGTFTCPSGACEGSTQTVVLTLTDNATGAHIVSFTGALGPETGPARRLRSSVQVPLGAVAAGSLFRLQASWRPPPPDTGGEMAGLAADKWVHSAPMLLYRHQYPPLVPPTAFHTVVVTAANEPYMERLRNLIGSLHYWAPLQPIVVYDLGLQPQTKATVESWANVEVRDLPWSELPPHFRQVSTCAWKAWVVMDALHRADPTHVQHALWLDANLELRRPLDEMSSLIARDGSFLTIAGHLFPTDKVVRPSTLRFLNCTAPFASRVEATSAMMGVTRGSLLHTRVLPSMHYCALDLDGCHWPQDATMANQRRDQSALNAVLCALEGEGMSVAVHGDKRWWMWSQQTTYSPTRHHTHFNDMMVYSRRGEAPFVYSREIRYKRKVQATSASVESSLVQ